MKAVALVLVIPAIALAQGEDAPYDEFATLDLNGDRRVSLAEAAGHGDIVVRFDRADRNGDGRLTRGEFKRLKKLKLPKAWHASRS